MQRHSVHTRLDTRILDFIVCLVLNKGYSNDCNARNTQVYKRLLKRISKDLTTEYPPVIPLTWVYSNFQLKSRALEAYRGSIAAQTHSAIQNIYRKTYHSTELANSSELGRSVHKCAFLALVKSYQYYSPSSNSTNYILTIYDSWNQSFLRWSFTEDGKLKRTIHEEVSRYKRKKCDISKLAFARGRIKGWRTLSGRKARKKKKKERKKGNRNAVIPIVKKSPTKIQ